MIGYKSVRFTDFKRTLLPLLVLLLDFDHHWSGLEAMRSSVTLLYLLCKARVELLYSMSCASFSDLPLAKANNSETDNIGCNVEVWNEVENTHGLIRVGD